MVGRLMRVAVIGVIAASLAAEAAAHPCGAPSFAFGNAGYGAGFGIAGVHGWRSHCGGWSGGGFCGPRWRGGCHAGGWPGPGGGWWCGWPGLGFGGCLGAQWWSGCESISLSVPRGGGATFFSGRMVPFVGGCVPVVGGWPTNWYPGSMVGPWGFYPFAVPAPIGIGPQFGPAGIFPFLGAASGGGPRVGRVAAVAPRRAVGVRPAVRLVNEAARNRAARLVVIGDRHLREARGGAAARHRAAVDAYRRAAAAAPDDPDIRVREALALVALGDVNAADAAHQRAAAIDGRLAAAAPPRRDGLPPDPVFGDRPVDAPAPLAARGRALLREIGGADAAAVEWLAARWSDRWGENAAAVVSR